MSMTQEENSGQIRSEDNFDNTNSSEVSVQYMENQEGISQDTFDEDNILSEPTVKLSVQCVANQRGFHGQIVYDDLSKSIHLQPQAEPDIDEGIVILMEED